MAGHDPRGDLAPRDVVAARMAAVIAAQAASGAAPHVWLDATALGRELLEDGFPTVTAACRKHGIDPVHSMIPVAPGAHYSCGGIRADLDGRTSVPGLYAAGEAASTGVQGANRLASNSVTEAIIAGRRTGAAIADARGAQGQERSGLAAHATANVPALRHTGPEYSGQAAHKATSTGLVALREAQRRELSQAMSRYAGVIRDADGLAELVRLLGGCPAEPAIGGTAGHPPAAEPGALRVDAVEAENLRLVSLVIAAGAARRMESRGCHRRSDAVETAGEPWHTLARWDGRELVISEEKL
jgi:L-aspartate oxidase